MPDFYKNAIKKFFALIAASATLISGAYILAEFTAELLPKPQSDLLWRPDIEPDIPTDETNLKVIQEGNIVEYDFFLSSKRQYAYTHYAFNFIDESGNRKLVDLRPYDSISFEVHCQPRNIMLFNLFTFDEKTTKLSAPSSYRINSDFFTCNSTWTEVSIKLRELDTPDWWLYDIGLELIDREYYLDKVISFAVVNSLQSRRDTPSKLTIRNLKLVGQHQYFIYAAFFMSALLWAYYFYWLFRSYVDTLVGQVKEKMKQDRPFIAYQKLSISNRKNETQSALLRYLSTEYSDPDISIESTANHLGISRSKINEILKGELDLTFSAYLNKVRLTESARLLTEQSDVNIAQIAYAVGFKNVTYFNKLFKNEYGCTPKTFKNNYKIDAQDEHKEN